MTDPFEDLRDHLVHAITHLEPRPERTSRWAKGPIRTHSPRWWRRSCSRERRPLRSCRSPPSAPRL